MAHLVGLPACAQQVIRAVRCLAPVVVAVRVGDRAVAVDAAVAQRRPGTGGADGTTRCAAFRCWPLGTDPARPPSQMMLTGLRLRRLSRVNIDTVPARDTNVDAGGDFVGVDRLRPIVTGMATLVLPNAGQPGNDLLLVWRRRVKRPSAIAHEVLTAHIGDPRWRRPHLTSRCWPVPSVPCGRPWLLRQRLHDHPPTRRSMTSCAGRRSGRRGGRDAR